MTLIAALPIVGILFLFYSVAAVIPAEVRFSKRFDSPARRVGLLRFSRYDCLVFSFAFGLYLIYFFSKNAPAFLKPLWSVGAISFVLLIYAEHRRSRALDSVFFFFMFSLPLTGIFSFFGPSTALNFDDDLAKYLVLPIGLIHNGGLDFGPLGPQMGGASVLTAGLQALYLVGADLKWIAHWDIAVSLALIITLISFSGMHLMRDRRRSFVAGASLVFGIFIVNVMYVNISAVYLPAAVFALACGLFIASRRRSIWEAVGVGGVAAIFYLFKLNYILLSAATIGGYFLTVALWSRLEFKDKAILIGACTATFALVAPNAASSVVNILLSSFSWMINSCEPSGAPKMPFDAESVSSATLLPVEKMLSLQPTFYGYGVDSYFSINVFLVLVSLASVLGLGFAVFQFLRNGLPLVQGLAAVSLLGILSSLVLVAQYYLFFRNIGAIDANIRYMMPSVLGLVLFVIFSWWIIPSKGRSLINTCLMCIFLTFLGSQVASSGHRFYQALKHGNVLAFPAAREQFMKAQTEFVVGGRGLEFVAELQSIVPEGATILAAVGFPSLFDFQRNRILLAEADGELGQFDDAEGFFANYSVDFIFWQTRGLGVRTVDQWRAWGETSPSRARHAEKSMTFLNKLGALRERCESLSPIEQITIIRVASCSSLGNEP